MSDPTRVLVPSPSAFAFDLRPSPSGGLTARRGQVRMTLICTGVAIVFGAIAWYIRQNPIWSTSVPADIDEYGIPLAAAAIFVVIAAVAWTGFSRSITIDPAAKQIVFERRRFWRSFKDEVPFASAALVTAPILTEMQHNGRVYRWEGHVLYIGGGKRTFAIMAHADPQRVLAYAQKLSAETGIQLGTDPNTVKGIDC